MSIFDRFVSKETTEQEKKSFTLTPYKKLFSELDAANKKMKAQYPDDSKAADDFVWALKEICKSRYKRAQEEKTQPLQAEARFFLSEDRMRAFACLLPPENGGEEITLEAFLRDMRYEGIRYGVLHEEITQAFGQGYCHIFLIAQGKLPLEGEDGRVTELFHRRGRMTLEVPEGDQVDFGEDIQLQPVRSGTAICLIRTARPGTDGMDVTGQALPCLPVKEAYVPQGENTVLGRGGQALEASVDGILYIENDQFCIQEQKIIDGDLNTFQGALQISGNLYVEGNVDGGVKIEASGDIVINGKIGQGHVTSTDGTIRIQQGIFGTKGETVLSAAGQIQSPVVEWAELNAGASVITETISNSTIRCGGTVYAMTGRGMIADSEIRAGGSVLCLRIGNLAEGRSLFSVGYPPDLPESRDRIKTELSEVESTLDMLWKSVTDLRKKGTHISDNEKTVLDQLVKQRELYMEKRSTLSVQLKNVNKALEKRSGGRIQCEKLFPSLDVQIGRYTKEVTTEEENCNIHAAENLILLK